MGGDVFQWNETPTGSSTQGVRGGDFKSIYSALFSSFRIGDVFPSDVDSELGFRVALIPEPSSGVLAVVACGLMWVLRKRFE
jgi:formylglycine-generating enzyme